MCTVSFVGDFYKKTWEPYVQPGQINPNWTPTSEWLFKPPVTREEFEQLRKEVHEMIDLMKKAKEIDEKTGQPDCENEEKLKLLRVVAKAIMGEDFELPV